MVNDFKDLFPFEVRKETAAKFLLDNPDRLPIIIDTDLESTFFTTDWKYKVSCPAHFTYAEFCTLFRSIMKIPDEVGEIILIKKNGPLSTMLMSSLYARYKDEDGFLYMKFIKNEDQYYYLSQCNIF